MVQAPDLWNLDHRVQCERLDGSGDRCVFFHEVLTALGARPGGQRSNSIEPIALILAGVEG
jgi:hypothetical protein